MTGRPDPDDRPIPDPDLVARAVLELFPDVLGVWLFGSFAEGRARPDSDVDIAILPEHPIEQDDDYLEKLGRLSMRFGRLVDLVDLRKAPPVLRFEIFSDGLRIATRDPVACDFFETTAISAYQRLNVERREVMEAARERLLGHG
jgi:predicted nucleotidyltransferase